MARVIRLTDEMVREELAEFERKHGMTSAEFYERFLAADLPEHPEHLDWAWTYEIALKVGAPKSEAPTAVASA